MAHATCPCSVRTHPSHGAPSVIATTIVIRAHPGNLDLRNRDDLHTHTPQIHLYINTLSRNPPLPVHFVLLKRLNTHMELDRTSPLFECQSRLLQMRQLIM